MYGRRTQQGSYDDSGGGGNAVYMTVASSIVGAIIGRGGTRIRELEETSGARIKIYNSDNDDGGERKVEITGSPQSQDSAKNMIEQVIDGTYQDEYGGGGGGGRYGGGGGRYGGGGGGGGGGNCFKCGEAGHFARDCSSGGGGGGMRGGGRSFGRGGGGGGGGGNCYKCGESGHFARECTSSDNYGGSRGGSRW